MFRAMSKKISIYDANFQWLCCINYGFQLKALIIFYELQHTKSN